MNSMYISTVPHAGKVIDARCLTFAVEFYQLNPKQVIALSAELTEWLTILMDQAFISRYIVNGKRGSKNKAIEKIAESIHAGKGCSWALEAFAESEKVYSQRTMNDYLTTAYRSNHNLTPAVSVDYPPFWNNLFPADIDLSSIVSGIYEIFQVSNKKHMTGYFLPDFQVAFSANPYLSNNHLLYGHFQVHFSRFCIGMTINRVADTFCGFAKSLSERYLHLNARVQLQPIVPTWRNPYMRYFGANGNVDGSHVALGLTAKEWYSTYYIPGVEWFNILSPLAQCHISKINTEGHLLQGVCFERLPGGGLIVASPKAIDGYDVADAVKLKEVVHAALFPGGTHIPLRRLFRPDPMKFTFELLPRCDWAIVPMSADEIDIVGTELVFRSSNSWKTDAP